MHIMKQDLREGNSKELLASQTFARVLLCRKGYRPCPCCWMKIRGTLHVMPFENVDTWKKWSKVKSDRQVDCAGENKSKKMILHDRHTSTLGDVTFCDPFDQVWYTKHRPGSHVFEVCQLEEEPSLVDSWNSVLFSDLLLQKGPFREISSPLMYFLWSLLAGPCHVAVHLYSWTGLLPCGGKGLYSVSQTFQKEVFLSFSYH